MEAIGMYDFKATANDELDFCKNSLIKIICMENDMNWYTAELNGRVGLVPANYICVKTLPSYVPHCSRNDAEAKLKATELPHAGAAASNSDASVGKYTQPEGAFVVRQSESGTANSFSLSVRNKNEVLHFKIISHESGRYSVWLPNFVSINQLIEYYTKNSICTAEQNPNGLKLKEYIWPEGLSRPEHCRASQHHPTHHPPLCASASNNAASTVAGAVGGASSSVSNSHAQSHHHTNTHTHAQQHNQSQTHQQQSQPMGGAAEEQHLCTARYDFKATHPDELTFRKNDVILKVGVEDVNWWIGECNGVRGIFPRSYVDEKNPGKIRHTENM